MLVYRLTKPKRSNDISGRGAALFPGRWNHQGTPVLYTGENEAIALLENIVHIPAQIIPKLSLMIIEIPDDSILVLDKKKLPLNWFRMPGPTILKDIGQAWISNGVHVAMKVPSAVIHTQYNYILNCAHLRYKEVAVKSIQDFYFDTRLR